MLALCQLEAEEQKGAVTESPLFVETTPDTHMICAESLSTIIGTSQFLCAEKLEHTFLSSTDPYQEHTQTPINSKQLCLDPDGSVKIWPY